LIIATHEYYRLIAHLPPAAGFSYRRLRSLIVFVLYAFATLAILIFAFIAFCRRACRYAYYVAAMPCYELPLMLLDRCCDITMPRLLRYSPVFHVSFSCYCRHAYFVYATLILSLIRLFATPAAD